MSFLAQFALSFYLAVNGLLGVHLVLVDTEPLLNLDGTPSVFVKEGGSIYVDSTKSGYSAINWAKVRNDGVAPITKEKLDNVDYDTFQPISKLVVDIGDERHYARDKNHVYFYSFEFVEPWQKVEEADPKSFMLLSRYYSKDKNNVYQHQAGIPSQRILTEADLNSFEDLGFGYAKDAQRVYYRGQLLEAGMVGTDVCTDDCIVSPNGRYLYLAFRDGRYGSHLLDLMTGRDLLQFNTPNSDDVLNVSSVKWLSDNSGIVFVDAYSGIDGTGSESVYALTVPGGELIPIHLAPPQAFTSQEDFLEVRTLTVEGEVIKFMERRRKNCQSLPKDTDGYCRVWWHYDWNGGLPKSIEN